MVWSDGQLLHGGKYKIVGKPLGRGGFGITYKALHISLNQDVVVKTPDETLKFNADYAKYIDRFIKEAQLLAKLCKKPHPHIVRVIDLFKEGNTHCLVMDFIAGKSLWDLVQCQGALPETEAVEYIRQIGQALRVVHQATLVHRDVNPNNIMLRVEPGSAHSSEAVLIDFGIAGEMSPPSSFSRDFGNKTFAPYELRRSGHATVDIYSLAASLYYAVTGKCPTKSFDCKYEGEKLLPPKRLAPTISDCLDQAILQGMALEATDRPQSIDEWLNLLPSRDVSKTPTIQKLSTTASTASPQKPRSIFRDWLTGSFSLISWATVQEITSAAKNHLHSMQRWLNSLVSRFPLKPLINRESRFKASTRLHQQVGSIPWGWLIGAFIGYTFTGLLFAVFPSPALTLAGAFAGASAGAFAGVFTEVEVDLGTLTWGVIQAVGYIVFLVLYLVVLGIFLVISGACLSIGAGLLIELAALFLVVIGAGAIFLTWVVTWGGELVGVKTEAKTVASSLFWVGKVAESWAGAVAKLGLKMLTWTVETTIKFLAWVLNEAGGWAGTLVWICGWLLALTWVVALAEALAWTGKKLPKSFSRFHSFLILAITSWTGLGLGWLATFMFR